MSPADSGIESGAVSQAPGRHEVEAPEQDRRRRALGGERRRETRPQPVRARGQPRPDRLREERDPADRGEREHGADREEGRRRREEEAEGREPDRLGRADRPLEQARREEDPDDEPRAHGRRVGSADEHEEKDRGEQDEVPRLALDTRERQGEEHEARLEDDVEPGHDQEVVEAAPPVARDHAAIELRSPAEQQRREGPADVALEPRVASHGGQRGEERPVGPGQRREERAAPRLDHPRALDREAEARPRPSELALRRRHVLGLEPTRHAHPVAAPGDGLDRRLAGHEDRHLGRKRPPGGSRPEALGRERRPRARRRAAPEIRETPFDDVGSEPRGRQPRERAGGRASGLGDAHRAAQEPCRQPGGREGHPKREATLAPREDRQPRRRDGEESSRGRDPLGRPGPEKDPAHEPHRGLRRRRTAAGEDRADHAARSREIRASTRCVSAKRSKSRASRMTKPSEDQNGEVAAERRRIAGHVDERVLRSPRELARQIGPEPRARRIGDDAGEAPVVALEEGVDPGRDGLASLGIGPGLESGRGILGRAVVRLHRRDAVSRVEQRSRKETRAAEGVERVAGGRPTRRLPDSAVQRADQVAIALEERVDRDAKDPAFDGQREPRLAPAHEQGPVRPSNRHAPEFRRQGGGELRRRSRGARDGRADEPARALDVLEQRHLGHVGPALPDRRLDPRQERPRRRRDRLAAVGRHQAVGPGSEVAERSPLRMEPGPQPVARRRGLDRQRAEKLGPEPRQPLHRLEEELALGPAGGPGLEVRPVATGAVGVRPRRPGRAKARARRRGVPRQNFFFT